MTSAQSFEEISRIYEASLKALEGMCICMYLSDIFTRYWIAGSVVLMYLGKLVDTYITALM